MSISVYSNQRQEKRISDKPFNYYTFFKVKSKGDSTIEENVETNITFGDNKLINNLYNNVNNDVNNNVCLNIMIIPSQINELKENKNDMRTILIDSLKCFDFKFKFLFVVIDSRDKHKDVEMLSIEHLTQCLTENNIISNEVEIKCDYLKYETELSEYKNMLKTIFNFKSLDDIIHDRTYKNAFAYYYSLYNSPCKYMVHIDIPRSGRVRYIKNNDTIDENISDNKCIINNYIKKSIYLLNKYNNNNETSNVCFVGLINEAIEGFIQHPNLKQQYACYFDSKCNISLQCFVCDTSMWKSKCPYNAGFYRYQTENAISSATKGKGLVNIALLPNESNVHKINF